ncbi:b467b1b6-d36a-49a4-a4eb-34024350c8a5 [Thermothielavioides terrestris]|uniref:Mediator of RNA polymerase II transcription subunit 22 n=2 Tax=Thermothielavioides terrestris TaxID=2587410 RepID=G2R960_THETT|nr:uncharacterized protein THITE_2096374 [Thermothielavioides terrestris NRRL 8126]AEO68655.1 hypothetical protein THITE_2096374 [Thermothielavioides terrestris NRRL 8126]SPQ23071.1 b467b1b6-d36a-49a4-a4eb-34024350c8a5 [Thermothielavioides terrestris]
MDRDPTVVEDLLERKNVLVAEIMTAYRDLVKHATAQVDSSASTGQAAYSSMALGIMMSQIIKSTEDLLALTRRIRELWVVGPLKAPGAHDAEAEQRMRADAEHVFAMLNAMRDAERRGMVQAFAAAASSAAVAAAPAAAAAAAGAAPAPAGGGVAASGGGGTGGGGGSGFTFERAEVDGAPAPPGAAAAAVLQQQAQAPARPPQAAPAGPTTGAEGGTGSQGQGDRQGAAPAPAPGVQHG